MREPEKLLQPSGGHHEYRVAHRSGQGVVEELQ